MLLKRLEVSGFKSFAKKTSFDFNAAVVAIVGPNGSGKSNVAESIRFVLGEQSMKSMRSKRGEDLIWNGSNTVPRAGRASAAIIFDNTSRFLAVDFDEVSVERTVHRDGAHEYRLNGSVVRLKDIQELLAGANIGESGHHIISQGEADKILAASPADRREMLEDALGITMYQYKKGEALKKLDKTEENMRQVEALRREIAPHLRFLRRQVEKIERAEELRRAARERFHVYFKREEAYVLTARERVTQEYAKAEEELQSVLGRSTEARAQLERSSDDARSSALLTLSRDLERARAERAAAARAAARLQGEIAALSRITERATVSSVDLMALAERSEAELESLRSAPLDAVFTFVRGIFEKMRALTRDAPAERKELESRTEEYDAAVRRENELATFEARTAAELESLRERVETGRQKDRENERVLFELSAAERDVRYRLAVLESERERVRLVDEEFVRELSEVAALLGRDILEFRSLTDIPDVPREDQEREKRELQKVKIRLEEAGLMGSDDIVKEYREANERESHLEKEIADLTAASEQLTVLIRDLDAELSKRFDEGLHAINREFHRFFSLLFEGGTAALTRVREVRERRSTLEDGTEESEQVIEGIDIALTIPRKRIQSLVMLSGGERALTSIALIFAMSSVNPPPFLILDETDAALDEANSKRYGDMIAALSEKSQLVVITHNRETMSRAQILYGVTMGGDGVSKVLSVKLEDAVKVAK